MTAEGIVFNIQRFCTHDGPGIRTTVFLKGCPLGCLWCSNPESQALGPQLMTRDVKCVRCGSCAKACSRNAISFSDESGRRINWERCNHCFECVDACLYGALTAMGETKTAESVAAIIGKDSIFYRNSGGGATISGGEPLLQHDFLFSLLSILKQKGIHIALDTTGHAAKEVVDKILPLTDLVLYDIKHLDARKHRELTGVDNALILKNVRSIAERVRTWFRIPLIAGINDSEEHIAAIADLAMDLGVEKISLLPFHEGGITKWTQVGKAAPVFTGRPPDDEHLKRLSETISQRGLLVGVRN